MTTAAAALLLLLLLGIHRSDNLMFSPVVQTFKVILARRHANTAVVSFLRFQAFLVLRPEGVAPADAAA
eukprot:CAMPEP_0178564332 /NCGR_PEP_ID=MMETSP0697-20121206/13571_1 /TAXON_ID=265572 /ORGANISM="Extubocellulus spinifer, Strain CCMP396" /LENGTH=68 /DNA_ID=CAMNT_0020197863 /DNA_START=114 /DNA_END=320 /DNA_ORIENTATION=+